MPRRRHASYSEQTKADALASLLDNGEDIVKAAQQTGVNATTPTARSLSRNVGAASKKELKPLKPRQRAFVEYFIANGGNATDAARKAGVNGSDGYVRKAAHLLVTNGNISAEIQERTRERLEGVKADADEVLYLLADHLRADIGDFIECFDDDGYFDLPTAKRIGISHLIKKLKMRVVEITPEGRPLFEVQIELHNSQTAAGLLAKIYGLAQEPRHRENHMERVNQELMRLIAEGWPPEEARKILIEAEPSAAVWLN